MTKSNTELPKIGTREEWLAARKELLELEKELTRRSDELARQRGELPWVRVDKEYVFETNEGKKTLVDLFDGRSQLLIHHFMFGPEYVAGCPVCSSAADSFNGVIPHLNARDVTMVCVSRAPLKKLNAYKQRMGWSFSWVSSFGSDFNFDFSVSLTKEQQQTFGEYNYRSIELKSILEEGVGSGQIGELADEVGTDLAGYLQELPGLSAFALEDGVVYHTYSTYARGGEFLLGYYPLLDRAPKGRNEGSPPEPWIRRHDEYEKRETQ